MNKNLPTTETTIATILPLLRPDERWVFVTAKAELPLFVSAPPTLAVPVAPLAPEVTVRKEPDPRPSAWAKAVNEVVISPVVVMLWPSLTVVIVKGMIAWVGERLDASLGGLAEPAIAWVGALFEIADPAGLVVGLEIALEDGAITAAGTCEALGALLTCPLVSKVGTLELRYLLSKLLED